MTPYYHWFFFTVTAEYLEGKLSAYVYDGQK